MTSWSVGSWVLQGVFQVRVYRSFLIGISWLLPLTCKLFCGTAVMCRLGSVLKAFKAFLFHACLTLRHPPNQGRECFEVWSNMRCLGSVPPRFTYVTRTSSKTSNVFNSTYVYSYIYIYVTHMHVYKAHMHVYIICIICIHAKQSKWCCPTMKGAVMCRILSCNLRTHCAHCLRQVMAGCCETWSLIILSLSKAVALVSKQFNQFSSWIVEIGGQSHPQPKRCMNIYEGNSLVA